MYKLALRKDSLTRQFMPSLGINQPETLKKVAPSLPDTKETHAREKEGDTGLLNWQLGSAY